MSEVVKSFYVVDGKSCYAYGNGQIQPASSMQEKRKKALQTEEEEKAEKIIARARKAARKTVDDTNVFATKIIEKASKDAKAIAEKARKDGYRDGFSQGKKEAAISCEEELNEVSRLIRGIEGKREEMIASYQSEIQDLAFRMAKKIIGSELDRNDQAFLSLYQNAVKEIKSCEWLKVMVSECEVSFATANAELLLSMVKDAKKIEIVPLENEPQGTMIVETPDSIVDGSVATQMERLKKAFCAAELSAGVGKKD